MYVSYDYVIDIFSSQTNSFNPLQNITRRIRRTAVYQRLTVFINEINRAQPGNRADFIINLVNIRGYFFYVNCQNYPLFDILAAQPDVQFGQLLFINGRGSVKG